MDTTSEFWQRVSATTSCSFEVSSGTSAQSTPISLGAATLWMTVDAITVLAASTVATLYELRTGPLVGARGSWFGVLIHGRSMTILWALLCGFTIALFVTSRRLHLYTPTRLASFLHEQRLSMQACITSGLLLTGILYLIHAEDISRRIVLTTLILVTIGLGVRRLVYRALLYRRFDHGVSTRNVLIIGTGPEAHALRRQLENVRRLGYTFKGFIHLSGSDPDVSETSEDVVGTLDTLFQHARRQFVDEIFLPTPRDRRIVREVLDKARIHGVDLRVIPDLYDGLAWGTPIEYVGQFPTIRLHCGAVPEPGLLLKRGLDILLSAVALVLLSPLLLAVALAVKLDSCGPVFYLSERIGKRGRIFRCMKFRTMVHDAETRRAEVIHMNERDGVLFKITNDPRITRAGRVLRKYSLDELPQFFNVLRGDMSIVGPRPPLASEVQEYKLSHLRRLDVTPGITGLWQVQARQDPSFDSYISLDVTYIDNWSLWLDMKIIARTIGVVFAGTGS
jgi:exopolysaccharide biosynthesis polyprenyl glycosylphosphotransferase